MTTASRMNRDLLKVFGGNYTYRGSSRRIIISAWSSSRAVAILKRNGLKMSLARFREIFSLSGNSVEIDIARGYSESVLYKGDNGLFALMTAATETGNEANSLDNPTFSIGQEVYWKDDSDQGSGILIGTVSAIVPAGHLPGSDVYRTGNRTPFWGESYVIRVEMVVAFRGNESTHKAVRMFWLKPSLLCAYEGSDH